MTLERLLAATVHLNRDEMAVVIEVAEGLCRGRAIYGPLDMANDQRDWRREAQEELRDCLVYIATERLRLGRVALHSGQQPTSLGSR